MRWIRPSRPARLSDAARRRELGRRWVLRSLACVGGAIACGAIAALVLVHSLDQPWLKRRLQGLVRASVGADLDYRSARVDLLSGLEIDGLVVHSPAPVRAFAPELVQVGRLSARWSLGAILQGRGPTIRRLAVSDVTVTVVVDERGRTSFDAFSRPGSTAAPGPSVSLSRQASRLLGAAPVLGELAVGGVTLVLVRTQHGVVSERSELRGLAIGVAMRPVAPPAHGWRVTAELGSPAAPLELALTRASAGSWAGAARARAWLNVDATASALSAALDLHMLDQTFAASVSADHFIHAEARVRFDPAAGLTELTLDHTQAADGAATAEASIEVPDVGQPIVQYARGDLDLARLLRWLPAGLVPVTAERARVRYHVESLVVGPVPKLTSAGAVAIEADLSNVTVSAAAGLLQLGRGALSLHAQPANAGALAGRASITLAGTRFAAGQERLAADDLRVELEGRQAADGALAGRAAIRFARVEHAGGLPMVARDGQLELRSQALRTGAADPLATQGDLAWSMELASLELRPGAMRASVDGLSLHAHTQLLGHAPYAVELETSASRARVAGRDGKLLVDAPSHVEAWARDVWLDVAHLPASRGVVHAAVRVGESQASVDLTKASDGLGFALRASAPSLAVIRAWLSPTLANAAPWEQMAVAVRSNGRVDHLFSATPGLRQTTELDVERPAFDTVVARSLSLTLKSQGTALYQAAEVDLRAQGLAFGRSGPGDDHLTLSAAVDRTHPSLRFQLTTEGRAITKISGSLAFDSSSQALLYELEGKLSGLAPLTPLAARLHGIEAFDLSKLDVDLSTRGALLGVVAAVTRDATLTLAPSPATSAAVEGSVDLRLAHLRWNRGDSAIATPALAWHADVHTVGARRTLDSRLEVGSLHLDLGTHDVDLNGIVDSANVTVIGNLAEPELELTHRLAVRAVEQDFVPEYPMGELTVTLSAERGPEGVVHISELGIGNGLGGTAIAVTGNVDLSEGRRTLSVTSSLSQELVRLSSIPERFKGQGKVTVEAHVTSPDLARYDVRAAVKAQDVSVALSRPGIELQSVNGEVPITVALKVGKGGVQLQRTEDRSAYSMLRFADQHPLLSHSGFLSITRFKAPFVSIAPLVGNLAIEHNVISLRQFELGVRGGSITGQCSVDWDGPKSTVELHVRASGVQSSHGEPFDGNIAVAISAADRTIEGRAEILRIGKRHLLDLLDLHDPLHVDRAMNRIRSALTFGYPDSLRLVFDHGFASAHLELGGLARLVSIGELRGIPMGPIVDKMLASFLDGADTKETP